MQKKGMRHFPRWPQNVCSLPPPCRQEIVEQECCSISLHAPYRNAKDGDHFVQALLKSHLSARCHDEKSVHAQSKKSLVPVYENKLQILK